jgi:hypothetical protein
MFEAAFPPRSPEQGPDDALRALDWSEIVARFAAARDLRAVLARPIVAGGGFVPEAVAGIAGQGERSVNLAALATGKRADPTTAAAVPAMGRGDRDN